MIHYDFSVIASICMGGAVVPRDTSLVDDVDQFMLLVGNLSN